MINAIVMGLFNLINMLFTAIFSPFFALITALFPSLSVYYTSITTLLYRMFTYAGFVLDIFFIPNSFIVGVFDYFIIKYSIFIISRSIKFIINIYNKLKF